MFKARSASGLELQCAGVPSVLIDMSGVSQEAIFIDDQNGLYGSPIIGQPIFGNPICLASPRHLVQRTAWHQLGNLITMVLAVLIMPFAWGQTCGFHASSASVKNTCLLRQFAQDHPLCESNQFPKNLQVHQIVLRQAYERDCAITLIIFDYATGTASRIVLDASRRKLLREQTLPGRPQSSPKEFQKAIEIISRERKLSHFLTSGAVPEGGFIVDGPPDYPSQDRYIQIRLLSADRRSLLRLVLVDLTRGAVVSDRPWYE